MTTATGTVEAHMTMSLDGFIADPSDGVGPLFDWYTAGDVTVPSADPRWTFRVDAASAGFLQDTLTGNGALICGRRLFNVTDGWGGRHPTGVPVFVVTHSTPDDWRQRHPGAPFTFVTDGVASAVAQAKAVAGDKTVSVAGGPNLIQQCINEGLLDAINVSLVPVLLGAGIRLFGNLAAAPVMLEDPAVVAGTRATHLRYPIR
jgi:dihydrofolate reductase